MLRWSYGSAFGLWHGTLRRLVAEPWASVLFGGTLISATFHAVPLAAVARRLRGAGRSMCSRPASARMSPMCRALPPSTTASDATPHPCEAIVHGSQDQPRSRLATRDARHQPQHARHREAQRRQRSGADLPVAAEGRSMQRPLRPWEHAAKGAAAVALATVALPPEPDTAADESQKHDARGPRHALRRHAPQRPASGA